MTIHQRFNKAQKDKVAAAKQEAFTRIMDEFERLATEAGIESADEFEMPLPGPHLSVWIERFPAPI